MKPEQLTPEKLHEWYLEICENKYIKKVANKKAQKKWEDLTDSQRLIDQLMCDKILEQKKKQIELFENYLDGGFGLNCQQYRKYIKEKFKLVFHDVTKEQEK